MSENNIDQKTVAVGFQVLSAP